MIPRGLGFLALALFVGCGSGPDAEGSKSPERLQKEAEISKKMSELEETRGEIAKAGQITNPDARDVLLHELRQKEQSLNNDIAALQGAIAEEEKAQKAKAEAERADAEAAKAKAEAEQAEKAKAEEARLQAEKAEAERKGKEREQKLAELAQKQGELDAVRRDIAKVDSMAESAAKKAALGSLRAKEQPLALQVAELERALK